MTIDLNKDVESPCKRTSSWGFIGYLEDGTECPIGVYSTFGGGTLYANRWLTQTKNADRWEAEALYEELQEEEG